MPLAVLILSHLARIQDMLLPNAGFMLVFKIFNIQLTNILCSPFTCKKKKILSYPHQNKYSICINKPVTKVFKVFSELFFDLHDALMLMQDI